MHRIRRTLLVAGAVLLVLTGAHSGGQKTGASVFFAAEALTGAERKRAAFLMGGVVFEYTDQDWEDHQDSLADVLTETYLAFIWAPDIIERSNLLRGYWRLTGHANNATLHQHQTQLYAYWHKPARLYA